LGSGIDGHESSGIAHIYNINRIVNDHNHISARTRPLRPNILPSHHRLCPRLRLFY
jgi:hypothetical protein